MLLLISHTQQLTWQVTSCAVLWWLNKLYDTKLNKQLFIVEPQGSDDCIINQGTFACLRRALDNTHDGQVLASFTAEFLVKELT